MAGGKEIKTKIASVQNTQKITAAMEMVAASKMRRAQDQMFATRPYAERIATVVHHVASAHSEYRHPFLVERPIKRVGIVAVSTDRGLCGGLNTNMFKAALNLVGDFDEKGVEIEVVTFGGKALGFFKRIGAKVVAEASHIGDSPEITQIIGPIQVLMQGYLKGEIDAIYLIGNEFINTMTQSPKDYAAGADCAIGRYRAQASLGLHLRARCQGSARRLARSLYRVAGLPGRGRECGL